MQTDDDPSLLTADQRLSEIAGIFAEGVLRLRIRSALPAAENPGESAPDVLELRSRSPLSDPAS